PPTIDCMICLIITPLLLRSTLFPYTTLFRSDVADEPARLLRVRDAEGGEAVLHERAQRRLVEPLREIALAECDVEAELRRLLGAARADLLELGERLLELLAVSADDLADEGVVHRAGEALRRAPLLELRLEHAHHVGGALILLLDRARERVAQLLLECHENLRDPSY